jgi:putative ABC transport system permease protein
LSLLDVLRFTTGALRGHRLRTALSMLGVAIGVAAVIALTALGEGARRYVTDQFSSLGTNILIVVPGKVETTGGMPGLGGAPRDLTVDDALAVARGVPEVRMLAPVSMGNESVSFGERSRQVAVIGSTAEMLDVRNLQLRSGRFLPAGEWDRGTPVAVLGSTLDRELFQGINPLGKIIRVGDTRMRVIGVLTKRGTTLGINMDDIVVVPVATGMRMFNRTSLFRMIVSLKPKADVERAKERIKALLMERHDHDEDFTLITQDAVMSAFSDIFNVLTLALAGIAAISLTVAGVGIMNVMLVSVSERTREIGLLKAVGARPRQILVAFLTEAVLLSLAGGLAGLAAGWAGVSALVAAFPALSATPPAWAVGAALAVCFGVGAVFGVLPARRATRLDPIAALRS